MTEPVPAPSSPGSVILDLGPGTGALVLHTPPGLDGQEIEISPSGGDPGRRTHSLVRERRTSAGASYAAVYPGLAAGDYTLWRDAATPAGTVTINGGQVTWHRWPDSPRPGPGEARPARNGD